jgi:hypothetical protein
VRINEDQHVALGKNAQVKAGSRRQLTEQPRREVVG